MRVTFIDSELRDTCASFELAERHFGRYNSHDLMAVIAEIEACQNARELAELWHAECQVTGHELSLRVEGKFILTLELTTPYSTSGQGELIQLECVTTLQLQKFELFNESD